MKSRKDRNRNYHPTIEVLEARDMLSVTATLADGVLSITGTQTADTIIVRQENNRIFIEGVAITQNGQTVNSVASSAVDNIQVDARGGADRVEIEHETDGDDQAITQPTTLLGGGGADRLEGGAGADFISGGDGADKLRGRGGSDVLEGGGGNDRLEGDGGNDTLRGGAGADELKGGSGADLLQGDAGNDRLDGEGGDDRLEGGTGNDELKGGLGIDFLQGGIGDDDLDGGDEDDELFGGPGNDDDEDSNDPLSDLSPEDNGANGI